jgi:hypothetical protein
MIGVERAGRNVACNNGFDWANGFQRRFSTPVASVFNL